MLKALFPEKKYVPIDDPFIEDQANENPNMFMMLNPPPAFYDEVQRAPGLFRFIKIKCDESDEHGQFCLPPFVHVQLSGRSGSVAVGG